MKKIVLIVIVVLLSSVSLKGQIVWKTNYEKACNITGVIYSLNNKEIGSIPVIHSNGGKQFEMHFVLDTYIANDTGEKIQSFTTYFDYGKMLGKEKQFSLDCSSIDELVSVISRLLNDKTLMYITKLANLKISGSERDNCIRLSIPLSSSTPENLSFATWGYDVDGEAFIKMLSLIKQSM